MCFYVKRLYPSYALVDVQLTIPWKYEIRFTQHAVFLGTPLSKILAGTIPFDHISPIVTGKQMSVSPKGHTPRCPLHGSHNCEICIKVNSFLTWDNDMHWTGYSA